MHIKVSIFQQQLILLDEDRAVREFFVSTAKNGAGEKKNCLLYTSPSPRD